MPSITVREQRQSQAPQPANVNLFCKQCHAQIGIFANEWIRLTSSYARSSEKGTHFGSEIGQRIQTVPEGAAAAHAVGCQMAEVFCRKCSNMVGQYCKSHIDTPSHSLINQYFYKLSRTFLKDGRTQKEVDPVFTFDSDITEPSQSLSLTRPRQDITPLRWKGTPLRQSSSTPATVQSAALKRRQDVEPHDSSSTDESNHIGEVQAQVGTDVGSERNGVISRPRFGLSQKQTERNFDVEDQVHQIQGRLLHHERRSIDQENFLNDQAARIHEQDAVIEEQRTKIIEQDSQISQISKQLEMLNHSIKELEMSFLQGSTTSLTRLPQTLPSDLGEHFEMMARSMRHAQSVAREVAGLRMENEKLRAKLSIPGASTSVPMTGMNSDALQSPFLNNGSMLGKRKRDESGVEQILTPHSDGSEDPSTQTISLPHNLSMVKDPLEIGVTDQNLRAEQIGGNEIGLRRSMQHTVHSRQSKNSGNHRVLLNQQAVSQPVHESDDENSGMSNPGQHRVDSTYGAQIESSSLVNVNFSDEDNEQDNAVTTGFDANTIAASPARLAVQEAEQNLTFVQDPSAFDNEDLSDDDDNDDNAQMFTFGDEDSTPDPQQENDGGVYPTNARDNRSTAPEPYLKPKKPVNRVKSHISLDRIHIATPWMFWEAIHKGQQPKLWKPPAIQTRKKELAEELVELGLQEWIYKDKKCKEYRQAVSAARARLREAKKAALLSSKGLKQPPTSNVTSTGPNRLETPVLSTIQNVRAANSIPQQDVEIASGDENPRPATSLHDKSRELHNASEVDSAPHMLTRGRARHVSTAEEVESSTSRTSMQSQVNKPKQTRAKRRRTDGPSSINGDINAQDSNQDDADGHEAHAEIAKPANTKKGRGRPRKSAPAAISTNAAEADAKQSVATDQTNIDPLLLTMSEPVSDNGAAEVSSSQPGSVAKQKILEKMRLKARQQEQEQEDAIMARDKLAEEAMAAMELDEMMA